MLNRRSMLTGLGLAGLLPLSACGEMADSIETSGDDILAEGAEMEQLADGFGWSEGPSWDVSRDCLYFTDVPQNTAYRWSSARGLEVFLQPSGVAPEGAVGMREPGANGLWFGRDGHLYLCNHGMRAVQRLNLDTLERETLVSVFEGQRFNSPNDLVQAADGTIFFTDPPYGLDGQDESPLKEMSVNGVYRLAPDGRCERLFDTLTRPNGIALSPDEDCLYIAQSDPDAPHIYRAALNPDGGLGPLELWFDTSSYLAAGDPGLPDGMCVSTAGTVFATGPGGVFVLSPEGQLRGRILTGRATANCAFGGDGHDLYMTAHDRLLRIRVRERGVQWRA